MQSKWYFCVFLPLQCRLSRVLRIHLTNLILVLSLVICLTSWNVSTTQQCGYEGCYLGEEKSLNIHLVAHTHDDVGWLKTMDEYYFGLRNEFHQVKVEDIIDTMINALMQNKKRRFIYVEMAYFHKWWVLHENSTRRRLVHDLVQQGQLQFVLGGWSMNDEVTTHYSDIIDQHTRGMRFLTNHFGECGQPLVAWQIDPFGHSREQASLFAQMGFDAVFAWRIDSQEKEYRIKNKHLEMMWKSSDDASDGNPIFMGVMEDGYFTPSRTCFDRIMCSGLYTSDPDIDSFVEYSLEKAKKFATNHILIPIGGDFQFQTSEDAFHLIDKFIENLNAVPISKSKGIKINAFYSTPSCYTRAVYQTNTTFPTKNDDFLPLMESGVTVWVGFYSTRPNLKRYVRVLSNVLQLTEKMAVMSGFVVENELDRAIDILRQTMGVLQHHDAVTGTSKTHVASNYAVLLTEGREACYKSLFYTLINSNFYKSDQEDIQWHQCEHLNVSACHISEKGEDFLLVLYNGHSQEMKSYFHLPLSTKNHAEKVQIFSYDNLMNIPVALHSVSSRASEIPERPASAADVEAVFPINLPPLGYTTYLFRFSKENPVNTIHLPAPLPYDEMIQNQIYRLQFNDKTGQLDGEFFLIKEKFSVKLREEVCYYEPHSGTNGEHDRSSGAYVFNPEKPEPVCLKSTKSTKIIRSSHVQEIHQEFIEPWFSQIIRIYPWSPFVEIEWTVGPLPIPVEVVLRYSTEWPTDGKYFTDANCRQTMHRERNKRAFPGFNQTSPVAGNYYPINCYIGIANCVNCPTSKYRLAVVNDRSQGGASIHDGQVELMVHRATKSDDGLGVEGPVDDRGADGKGIIARGKHWLLIASQDHFDTLLKSKTQKVFNEPIPLLLTSKRISQRNENKFRFPKFSGILKPLPANIRVLTLDRWKNDTFLLRLEHFHSKTSLPTHLGETIYIEFTNLFSNFEIVKMEELTLSGNRPVSHLKHRLRWWHWQDETKTPEQMKTPSESTHWMNSTHISLQSMQIRTFLIHLHYVR